MGEMCPKILGGYEYLPEPPALMGSPMGGGVDRDRPWFSPIFFVLKKYPQVCKKCVPNRTHPNGMPKGDGGSGVG